MDLSKLEKVSEYEWHIPQSGNMRVPGVFYAPQSLIAAMDDKVFEQLTNVAGLPGIVTAAYAMPDAHWGYGFPIGGVAAFDPDLGGVVSAGGVGFDISCGVRTLLTGLKWPKVKAVQAALANKLYDKIPAGMGHKGEISLDDKQMAAMLSGGARWAVAEGYGTTQDLAHIEDGGRAEGAEPEFVSKLAISRQRQSMATVGSGNHYLEVQVVGQIFDEATATVFGLENDDVVLTIHCGSRGLGHQVATEFLREMSIKAASFGIILPDRDLACAPLLSEVGQRYIGAMRAAINCALANRQMLTHLARGVFAELLPEADLKLLYDVSHNTCKQETHIIRGQPRELFVHRKGATRSLAPGHVSLPPEYKATGQPVLIGGSMGTTSYILAGMPRNETRAFGSACHGAGRSMSRRQAKKTWHGRALIDQLAERGILIRSASHAGVAEEAPGAYKDVIDVVLAAEKAGLARRVAEVRPVICIKG